MGEGRVHPGEEADGEPQLRGEGAPSGSNKTKSQLGGSLTPGSQTRTPGSCGSWAGSGRAPLGSLHCSRKPPLRSALLPSALEEKAEALAALGPLRGWDYVASRETN